MSLFDKYPPFIFTTAQFYLKRKWFSDWYKIKWRERVHSTNNTPYEAYGDDWDFNADVIIDSNGYFVQYVQPASIIPEQYRWLVVMKIFTFEDGRVHIKKATGLCREDRTLCGFRSGSLALAR